MRLIIKNSIVADAWITASPSERLPALFTLFESKMGNAEYDKAVLAHKIAFFNSEMQKKWNYCGRRRALFEKRYSRWLNWAFLSYTNLKRGRPAKEEFCDASRRTKHRRVENLIESYSIEELEFALKKMKKANKSESSVSSTEDLPISEALALYKDLDLSERKYNILREKINRFHKDFIPSLNALQSKKQSLMPAIKSTEYSAEVDLRTLLLKTAQSILIINRVNDDITKASLVCKWGMDGSSGHSRYKQNFSDEKYTDEFMFLIALVPLRMIDLSSKKNIWTNNKCSSSLYCRPIKFSFNKENRELVLFEYNDMLRKIENLEDDVVILNGKAIQVSYEMHCTMIDGSVANILTSTNASSNCFICHAKPTEMNIINFTKVPIADHYKYGLSTLHAWIRCFECLLHIAYRLPFKCWQVRKQNKDTFLENKARIQGEFRTKLCLIVDQVKTGFGTTNDGNSARTFFSNAEVASEVTGINKNLIENFSIILRLISCGMRINIDAFSELLKTTRAMYLSDYEWYYMPSSVHKILMHGCEVIQYFDLPIGNFSEEALEALHKHIRSVRYNHTRKTAREHTNRDLLSYLTVSSDPEVVFERSIIANKNTFYTINELKKYLVDVEEAEMLPHCEYM